MHLSKSRYTAYWNCPKMLWLRMKRPELEVIDSAAVSRMNTGNEVGDLAMNLFGPFVEVTARAEDGRLDLSKMIRRTAEEMAKGTSVICEASFSFNGLYCAVDLLRRERDGWAIYEVKSSTKVDAVYLADIAYQRYVLQHCGVDVTGAYLVHLNTDYIRHGELELEKLFAVEDVWSALEPETAMIEDNLADIALLLDGQEPDQPYSDTCFGCGFCSYCTRDFPSPSVFSLYRMNKATKAALANEGLISLQQVLESGVRLNEKQRRQIDFALEDHPTFTDKAAIRKYLSTLSYPLYFLDFETIQPAIPLYDDTKPYQQIPFQYSLHYIEREGGELLHKEYLAEPEVDPRRAISEHLCRDIPAGACVTAYNKAFECTRIKELAELFPDLSDHLISIRDSIVDLLTPFQSGWYYNRAMGGSFSIKSVLPALFPEDPDLDYHNLEAIHNGSEAMTAFPAMAAMSPEERAKTRENLLKYCGLDTYAMVKVWEKLKEAAQ